MNFSYKHRNSHTNNSGLVVFKVYFVVDRISDKDLTRTHFVMPEELIWAGKALQS